MAVEGFKTKLLSALGWSAALKVGFQALSWIMTLAVIRVLSPNDYGLMAISQAFMTFMLGFANLGLGDALMQRKDTPHLLVSYAFGLLLLVSGTLCVGLALAAYPIASWYGDPRLVPLLQLSSLGFLFNAFTMLPRTMLAKEMQMRPIFAADLSSGLLGAVVTTILAFTGHGVWSLILGWVASNVVRQVAFLIVGRQFYVWPRLNIAAVRPLLGFGAYTTLEYTAFMITTTADVLIVSRLLGAAEVGIYTVVLNFAALPLSKVAPIVNSIAFPAFAMVQGDRKEASYYVLKGVRMMAVLVVPVFFGIAATAPEVVDIIFGETWAAARPLLPILSLALTFRAMLILLPNYLMGIGDAKGSFWCTGIGTVIFPLAVLTGLRMGATRRVLGVADLLPDRVRDRGLRRGPARRVCLSRDHRGADAPDHRGRGDGGGGHSGAAVVTCKPAGDHADGAAGCYGRCGVSGGVACCVPPTCPRVARRVRLAAASGLTTREAATDG